jgi:cyclophilin family peptidyl-prolyl cis-trans isomerase
MNWRRYAFPIAILAVAAVAGIVVLIVNSGGDEGGGSASAGCQDVSQPQPRQVGKSKPPTFTLDPDKTYRALIRTSCGDIVIQLDSKQAPKTGGSFVTLARDGFYDNTSFHRIAPGFVIQGGDPNGDGTGGPGYKVREKPPADIVYSKGVVAMAKGGAEPAGTSGSQFFIVTGDSTGLTPDYALLGKVVSGNKAITAIESEGSTQDGPPKKPIVIDKVTVTEG